MSQPPRNDPARGCHTLPSDAGADLLSPGSAIISTHTTHGSKCYFLNMIPIELRNMIYEGLLLNPDLGGAQPDESHKEAILPNLSPTTYSLFPAILATCHQIHDEASEILYHKNTFIMSCYPMHGLITGSQTVNLSPLTRYISWDKAQLSGELDNFGTAGLAISRVRNWKVLIQRPRDDYLHIDQISGISRFCRAISHSTIMSLEIWIEPEDSDLEFWEDHCSMTFKILKGFRMLRNIKEVIISEDDWFWRLEEACDFDPNTEECDHIEKQTSVDDNIKHEVHHLIESNTPVERLADMYHALLRYAQAFEHNDLQKITMGVAHCWDMEGADGRSLHGRYIMEEHPVEEAMILARMNAIYDYQEDFEAERLSILSYLEPQYQRIGEKSKALGYFIETHGQPGGFLSPGFRQSKDFKGHEEAYICNLTDALACLQEYADALGERDMPESIRAKKNARSFDKRYASRLTETALSEMRSILQATSFDVDIYLFRRRFRAVAKDLNVRDDEIRRARDMLFKFDVLHSE